jgi:GLPGLI family protein
MTTVIRVLVLALTVVVSTVNAQGFQGEATYRTQRKLDIKMDSTSTGISKDMHAKMMDMMKKQFQKTYKLSFNKEASIYKEEESLDQPQLGGGDMQFKMIGGGGGADILYKNTKEKRYADQKDTMGKIFLVKDDIDLIDWKLESDTKYIGEYQCYKATYTKQVEVFNDMSFSSNSNTKKEDNKAEEEKEPEMEERIITAWYTPQISVNNGPAMYHGLPGLILEVHDGKLTIICSKIVINPEDKLKIKEPEKGKEVSQEKYDEIMDKKSKEMLERFAPRNGRKGEGIEIRIGG